MHGGDNELMTLYYAAVTTLGDPENRVAEVEIHRMFEDLDARTTTTVTIFVRSASAGPLVEADLEPEPETEP